MKKTLIIFCVVAALIIGIAYARRTSPLFNFLFTPSDMFVPLAATEVDLSKQGLKVELPFKPKYPGNHQLNLEVEKLDLGTPFKGKFLLDVRIKNKKNESVIKRKVAGPSSSYWSDESKGFLLQSFVVPDQIGLGENGTVEVTLITKDVDFETVYGRAKLIVAKGSDE